MSKTFICNLPQHVGQTATLSGWIYNLRSSGKIAFLQFRDGTGFCQVIANQATLTPEQWADVQKLTLESSVVLTGIVSKHPKKEDYELQLTDIQIVQIAGEYPLGKKEHGPDFLLDNRHLWLRSSKQWAIQRVRDTIISATYGYFHNNHFIKIDAPILTPNACEGTTTLFEMEYFDLGKAYLSQSGQLYIEAAIMSHGRVFDFGPVFRAEKSKTRRHLTEFWMMDAEAAFVEHDENLQIQEQLVSHIVQTVLAQNRQELAILERDVSKLEAIKAPFHRMTHAEAVRKLREMGSDIKEDDDLGGDDEGLITQGLDKPLFIEKYPAKVKAFYMKRDPNNSELALCADMLAPEGFGEIIGGSQREDSYEVLKSRIEDHGLPLKAFEWYLDLRRYGSVPHSGFGYGLERLTGWICGTPHVRETIPFPRLINRLYP
jgi:asparaginyl-tRNA synthetase